MKPVSFRLRLALLSGLTTGLLISGTALALWHVTERAGLDLLDRELRNIAAPNLDREHGPAHYRRLEDSLALISGEDHPNDFILLARDARGRVIFTSDNWPVSISAERFPAVDTPIADSPEETRPLSPPAYETVEAEGRHWRVGRMGNGHNTLVLGMDMGPLRTGLDRVRLIFLTALPASLTLAGVFAWWLARRATRPVAELARLAEGVTARGLDRRLPDMPRDREFNRLVAVFNAMLDRLEAGFRQATRFSADASHELKTPLARLRLEVAEAFRKAPEGSPEQAAFGEILRELQRLNAIVQKLLLLSLADAGRLRLHTTPTDLNALLANILEDTQAASPHLTVEAGLAPGVTVDADAELLEQALQNLAGNAAKYNRPDGRIHITMTDDAGHVRLVFANTGPGIPEADRERVFERFHRADPARSARVEGVGLGLSLAREIIRAHGGELRLLSGAPDDTRFEVTLPRPVATSAT